MESIVGISEAAQGLGASGPKLPQLDDSSRLVAEQRNDPSELIAATRQAVASAPRRHRR